MALSTRYVVFTFHLFVVFLLCIHCNCIRIGAFNIQEFGPKKSNNDTIMKILAKIVKEFDILSIEEIHDMSKSTPSQPLEELAIRVQKEYGLHYRTIKSMPMGRKAYKERLGFIYRDNVSVIRNETYENGECKEFERDPFLVQFKTPIMDIVLGSVHLKPDVKITPIEISNLGKVFKYATDAFKTENIVILGDLNAGTNYVKNWTGIPIAHDSTVHWLINNDVSTTVRELYQAYDRILMKGEKLYRTLVKGSNNTFNFKKEFKLDMNLATRVSDHFPVQCQLSTRKFVKG